MAINTVEDSVDVWEEAVMDNLKKWHSEIKVLTTVNIRIMSSGTQLHVVWQIGTNISKRGRWHVPPEYCYLSSKLHGIPSNNVNFTTQDSPKLSKALHLSENPISTFNLNPKLVKCEIHNHCHHIFNRKFLQRILLSYASPSHHLHFTVREEANLNSPVLWGWWPDFNSGVMVLALIKYDAQSLTVKW